MGKKITSEIKGWEGTVTIADPLFLPQVLALRKATREVQALGEDPIWEETFMIKLPSLLTCIEEWDIKGKDQPTAETFPYAGTDENWARSIEFITWLHKEVWALFVIVEEDDPKD